MKRIGALLLSTAALCLPSLAQAASPEGALEEVTAQGVARGWAYDPGQSAQSITVNLYADGATDASPLATVTANVARPDINSSKRITGQHGFEYTLPGSLRDGQKHTLRAVALAQGGPEEKPVYLKEACEERYGSPAEARAGDINDAFTWRCWRKAGGPAPDVVLGGMDLNSACAKQAGSGYAAALEGPRLAPKAAFNWKCRRAGQPDKGMDLKAHCADKYREPAAEARARDVNDAYSWQCWAKGVATTKDTDLGDVSMDKACEQQHGDGFKSTLTGPRKAPGAANTWKCRREAANTALGSKSFTLSPNQAVTYTIFGSSTKPPPPPVQLYPWTSKRLAILTADTGRDPEVMQRLFDTFEDVYDFYAQITGKTPHVHTDQYDKRLTIAVVPTTCGGGCGRLGWAGIELLPGTFDELYNAANKKNPQYEQTVFYEFGRDFFFYSDQLRLHADGDNARELGSKSLQTGSAVAMRLMAMEAVRVDGAPFKGMPFNELKAHIEQVVDAYANDASLKWDNTQLVGQYKYTATSKDKKVTVDLGAADLFASIILRLADKHGGKAYVSKLWPLLEKQNKTKDPSKYVQQAVDNFIVASSLAANKDLTRVFTERWKWPAPSEEARKTLSAMKSVDPKGY